jgi:hypothetical protein
MTVKNVTTKIKEYQTYILIAVGILLVLCPLLAYGLGFLVPFWNSYALLASTITPGILWFKYRADSEETAETFLKKELSTAEDQLNAAWKQTEELETVLQDYEGIYDAQQWEIPCNCGQNTFIGLFSPYAENLCACDKCKNTYRITLNYESVLLTEPLDNDTIFASLKTRLDSEESDRVVG